MKETSPQAVGYASPVQLLPQLIPVLTKAEGGVENQTVPLTWFLAFRNSVA